MTANSHRLLYLVIFIVTLVLVLLMAIIALAWIWHDRDLLFQAVDAGEYHRLHSFAIADNKNRICITDDAAMVYLATQVTKAEWDNYVPKPVAYQSRTLYGDFTFHTGETNSVDMWIVIGDDGEHGLILSIHDSMLGDPKYYWVSLPDPMPSTLKNALAEWKLSPTH